MKVINPKKIQEFKRRISRVPFDKCDKVIVEELIDYILLVQSQVVILDEEVKALKKELEDTADDGK